MPLPKAAEAMLVARDGSRYGLRGWVMLRARPEAWRALHGAADGAGIRGALIHAVRAAGEDLLAGDRRRLTPTRARRFEQRLRAELTATGLDLRGLQVDGLDALAVTGAGTVPPPTRLLVVGLDGAEWEIIDPLIAQGKLPHLARLIETGASRCAPDPWSPFMSWNRRPARNPRG